MNVSKPLTDYIDSSFKKMLLQSKQLNQARADYKKSPAVAKSNAERMKRLRKKDKKLKELDDLKQYFEKAIYQEAKQKINSEYEKLNEKALAQEGDVTQNPLKGKPTTDFNNFLYEAFYFIKKEIPNIQDKMIYERLEDYLSENDYMMPDGDSFHYTDISSRIAFFKKLPDEIKQHFNIIFETSFEDFCKRRTNL